ncbi:pentatricopeptide repeat-containing protein At4g02750 [Cryptomeria japonica]|uniref:pentatricopeptide repeat-containing protein At4g02750 n=1 Tax=Cryptomeria japonica TaxID=3369 RepID=UPI0025ACE677|nr:pentatricopeptide repeat-containing protein At4g02750 [Cryptomeria japonica]
MNSATKAIQGRNPIKLKTNTVEKKPNSETSKVPCKNLVHVLTLTDSPVDISTYNSLLQDSIKRKSLSQGKLVHAHINTTGCIPNRFLLTTLLNMYAKCGSLAEARRVFDQMGKRDEITWTGMIAAYAKNGVFEEALGLFYEMQKKGMKPNQFTFASVIRACPNLAVLKDIHEQIVNNGFESDAFVGSSLVDMYGKFGNLENAREVFDKIPEPDLVTWNAMVAGYARNGHLEEALDLFQKMEKRDVYSWNGMIAGYAQNGLVDKAMDLFQRMPQRDQVSWNSVISGYAQNGQVEETLKLFDKMPRRDVVSWNTMIAAYAQNGDIDKACELFQKMPQPDLVSWNSMITVYAQNGRIDEALELFHRIAKPNVVSWNAIIAGHAQSGNGQEALKLYDQMHSAGVKPDAKTFATVLSACGELAALEEGIDIHKEITKGGFQSEIFVANALVDMYAKCGIIEKACDVFDKMPQRNTVSWTSMIAAYAMHGRGIEALEFFEKMQLLGTKPDNVTFICVLAACCHAGLVDKGLEYFDCMKQAYNLNPSMEHYACMVDLLGRAGRLEEAHDFINKMPIKPDANVWGCLLGACRVHNNVELGETVANHLFQLDPDNAAPYVLLSNIYAAAGRWGEIEKVRNLMKEKSVKKTPGCSWIEVNKNIHTFVVGDKSHPQMQKIYDELERLSTEMKEAGYVQDKRFVLNDVEDEQKEQILCHHSEKLAIAFGLINTAPGTPIRIIKNLRACGDCHSATKFISKIVAREIIVRDASRFHHFKDGGCSCGDYW